MEVSIKDNVLTIKLIMETPTPSNSGKSMIIASTRGNLTTDVMVGGKPLTVSVNAYTIT